MFSFIKKHFGAGVVCVFFFVLVGFYIYHDKKLGFKPSIGRFIDYVKNFLTVNVPVDSADSPVVQTLEEKHKASAGAAVDSLSRTSIIPNVADAK